MLNRRGSIRRPVALAALALTVLVLGGTAVAIFDRGSPQPTQAPRPIDTGNTFVSLLEVCLPGPPVDAQLLGCMHGHDVESVELFSLSSGRRLGSITTVPFAGATAVDAPAGTNRGVLFLTYSSGPRCTATGAVMECPHFAPRSCRNAVMGVSAEHTTPTPLFSVTGALSIDGVVPSPDGTQAAYSAEPCLGTHPQTGLYVHDLQTGRSRAIVRTSYCSSIGQPAWNASGTEVVFRFRASSARPERLEIIGSTGPGCPANSGHGWDLAIASTSVTTPVTALKLLRPARGCNLDGAAFDSAGIIAAEGCAVRGQAPSFEGATRGAAYIVQYDDAGHLESRIQLPYRGLDPEQTLLAPEPHSDRVLITQDQPNGLVKRNDDHIYELEGTKLRQVDENSWGSEFMAVPW
jgi:hypothetical protein